MILLPQVAFCCFSVKFQLILINCEVAKQKWSICRAPSLYLESVKWSYLCVGYLLVSSILIVLSLERSNKFERLNFRMRQHPMAEYCYVKIKTLDLHLPLIHNNKADISFIWIFSDEKLWARVAVKMVMLNFKNRPCTVCLLAQKMGWLKSNKVSIFDLRKSCHPRKSCQPTKKILCNLLVIAFFLIFIDHPGKK